MRLMFFYAEWCAPSEAMSKILDELEKELDVLVVERVDIDEWPEAAKTHDIRAVPSVLIIDERHVPFTIREQFVGVVPKERIRESLAL